MGVVNQMWLVDLDLVQGVWASRDEALLARLDAPVHDYTRRLLQVGGAPTAREAQRGAAIDILVGAACDRWEPHHYHFALEAICHELRTPLDVENDVRPRSLYPRRRGGHPRSRGGALGRAALTSGRLPREVEARQGVLPVTVPLPGWLSPPPPRSLSTTS